MPAQTAKFQEKKFDLVQTNAAVQSETHLWGQGRVLNLAGTYSTRRVLWHLPKS